MSVTSKYVSLNTFSEKERGKRGFPGGATVVPPVDYSSILIKNTTKTGYLLDLPMYLNDTSILFYYDASLNAIRTPLGISFFAGGEVAAYASSPNTPNMWDALPQASASVLGGVKLGNGLYWNNGKVDVSLADNGIGDVTKIYVDGSLSTRDTTISGKQSQLNGTGFVKASGTSISYDNNTYLTGITSGMITGALGYVPYDNTNPTGYITNIYYSDVVNALGFTPYKSINPSNYITGITSGMVTSALGYTPYDNTNPTGYITNIYYSDVVNALGYTPYNQTNPAGYITSSALTPYATNARVDGIEAIMSTDTERLAAVNALTSAYSSADTQLNDTLTTALTYKAPLASPSFTGTVSIFTNNEYPISYTRSSTKNWRIGADGNGTYFNNGTDNIIPVFFTNAGQTGFGTISPTSDVHIKANNPVLKLQTSSAGTIASPISRKLAFSDYLDVESGSINLLDYRGDSYGTDMTFNVRNGATSIIEALRIGSNGVVTLPYAAGGYLYTYGRVGGGNNGNILLNNGTGANFHIKESAVNTYTLSNGSTVVPLTLNMANGETTIGAGLTVNGATRVGGTDNNYLASSSSAPYYGTFIASNGTAGGWSRRYGFGTYDTGTPLGGFGGMGDVNSLNFLWIGRDWNDLNARFYLDAQTELYYDSAKKFETTASGTFTTGKSELEANIAGDVLGYWRNNSATGYGVAINGGNSGTYVLSLRDYSGSEKFNFRGDGVFRWGNSGADYGLLSWDTGKAIVGGQAGKNLSLRADGSEYGLLSTTGLLITGNITASGEVTAIYSSDKRLKKNIQDFKALEVVNKLQPKTFNWNEKAEELNTAKDTLATNYGLIAQEVKEVLPELVHKIYDDYLAVDYMQLVPILIQAIKEQQLQINELKNMLK